MEEAHGVDRVVGLDVQAREGPVAELDAAPDRGVAVAAARVVVSTTLSFPGGYTSTITVGDGDFMTQDGIWDIKVSKNPPTKEHTLQVLVYWLMGLHSCDPLTTYHGVERIGIFNPRLGQEFFIGVDRIPKDVLRSVQLDVIGYSEDELLYV